MASHISMLDPSPPPPPHTLSHGSLLYLLEDKAGVVGGAVGGATESRENGKAVKEDEVDVLLSQQDGVIHRDRDPQL